MNKKIEKEKIKMMKKDKNKILIFTLESSLNGLQEVKGSIKNNRHDLANLALDHVEKRINEIAELIKEQ